MLIERNPQSAIFHMEQIQPSLMAEIEQKKGMGFMIVSESDVTLNHEGAFQLSPGGESTFLPLKLPPLAQDLRAHNMKPHLVTGSRLGQASLDIHQAVVEDHLLITVVNNHPEHTYTFGQHIDIGKLVIHGEPLMGRALQQALEAEMYVTPSGMEVNLEQGLIEIPITKYYVSESEKQTIAISALPRAHDRRRLHEALGLYETTLDAVVAATHQGHYLSATDPLGFSKNYALWVNGGRAPTQDHATHASYPSVDHCEARLCQGGDNPWRIVNETYAPIDAMYASFFHAVTV